MNHRGRKFLKIEVPEKSKLDNISATKIQYLKPPHPTLDATRPMLPP